MRIRHFAIAVSSLWLLAADTVRGQESLSPAHVNGKWGYVDLRKQFVVEPRFDDAGPFSEGLAPVGRDGLYGYIDASGTFKIEPRYKAADVFSEGMAAVQQGERYGYIKASGEMAIEPQFDWAGPFRQGRAVFMAGEKFGYIDVRGARITRAEYSRARPFSEGLAAVSRDGERFGFIDRSGKEAIRPEFRLAGEFHEGLAWVQAENSQYRYIDMGGKFAVDRRFAGLKDFANGVAPARLENRWCVIDRDGRVLTEDGFDAIESLPGGDLVARMGRDVSIGRLDPVGTVTFHASLVDPDLAVVRFETTPDRAAIYKPTLWDFNHTPVKQDLQSPQYRVSSGDTATTDLLNVYQVYMIMFVRNNEMQFRRCVPGVDAKISASFP